MEDYEAVLACGGELQGMALVAKDLDGTLSVEQTDHMVRGGSYRPWHRRRGDRAGRPAALGDDSAIGAALGAGTGKLLHHKSSEKIGEQAGRDDPARRRGLDRYLLEVRGRRRIEPAVTRAVKKTVGEAEGRATSRP